MAQNMATMANIYVNTRVRKFASMFYSFYSVISKNTKKILQILLFVGDFTLTNRPTDKQINRTEKISSLAMITNIDRA